MQLRIEQEIFDSLPCKAPCLRVWQPLPALVATTAEACHPAFAAAAARAAARGLTVQVRRSGGGAVCLGPGMLVVSHLHTTMHNDIDLSYRAFAHKLVAAIGLAGVTLTEARVGRAYCDGKFDLAWRGLKVGGMAQRRRCRDGRSHVWIHAVLTVEQESLRYPREVARLYSDMGLQRVADPRNTTCLSECLPFRARAPRLLQRCADLIVGTFTSGARPQALLDVDRTCGGLHGDESVDYDEGVAAE
jgi:hypothetical protein